MNFKTFLESEESEEQKNVEKLLMRLPASHRKLVNGYKFTYTPNNTLNGDKQHIGYIYKDKIVVAAPWNYSRCFTTLHEIAHLVYEYLMDKKARKEWSDLVKATLPKQIAKFDKKAQKAALRQNAEEIFSMSYAATYSNHPPIVWVNDEWQKFIMEKIPNKPYK